MPRNDIGTEVRSKVPKRTSVRRPSCLVRLLLKIDDTIIWIARDIAGSFIDGLASYGMAHAYYIPKDRINSSALLLSKDADRLFEGAMSELKALAHTASLPGSLPP